MIIQDPKTILLLGGTSHIAKGLITHFLQYSQYRIEWFGRSRQRMEAFLAENRLSGKIATHENYESLQETQGDALINCVGAGTPSELRNNYTLWFNVLEKYDNACIEYLRQVNPKALYIDFSSGAVYGREQLETSIRINPNDIRIPDFYALSKLYSEAKHRAFCEYNIVDIRIFSYFSRYADLSSGYLMTDMLKAIIDNSTLKTSKEDVTRDYISPNDLFALIKCCLTEKKINTAFDAFSTKSVSKMEIIDAFIRDFKLKVDFTQPKITSMNSTPSIYTPKNFNARQIGYNPTHSSLSALLNEATLMLAKTRSI